MPDTPDIPDLPNQQQPEPGYACGGQPDESQLKTAAAAGLRRVINLRPISEDPGYDEATTAVELGLDYNVIPIANAQDLMNPDNVRQLDTLLKTEPAVPTLVHCASGNRVGALMALRAAWLQGQAVDDAVETGRRWGLKRLENTVRQILARIPAI